jgi:endo-1,4-beta-xylanase
MGLRKFAIGIAVLASSFAGVARLIAAEPATQPSTRPYLTLNNPPKTPNPLLQHKTYHSAAMNLEVGYNIYLPPGYADAANAFDHYPVIYWLHGLTNSESSDQFSPKLIQQAITEKKIPPLIFVYVSGGATSWYADSADGKWLIDTTIIKELIPHIDSTYRTIATRDARAIQGMSMGGVGCMKFALKYPELFSSVVSFAPAFRTWEEMSLETRQREIKSRMFGDDEARFVAEQPYTLAKKNVDRINGKLAIKFLIGDKDSEVRRNSCAKFDALLNELKVPHEFSLLQGPKHNLGELMAAVKFEALEFAVKNFKLGAGK